MRPYRNIAISTPVLCGLLTASPLHATTVRIVGLPKAGDGKQAQQQLVGLALKTGPGDELLVFDASLRKRIATIAIPNDPKYARVERRLPLLVQPMREVRAYTDAMVPEKAGEPNLVHGAAFLDEVGTLAVKYPNQDVRAMLLGSAWFTAPGATERAEYRGAFPSDGLILDDRASSPFGTAGLRDLTGVAVTYCFTDGPAAFRGPNHRDRLERAWSLEIGQRGGSLVTFSGDQKSCWDSFGGEISPEPRTYTVDPEDARMRYMYRPDEAAPRIMKAPSVKTVRNEPVPAAAQNHEAARFRQRASTTPPNRRDGMAWLGIQWADKVDLDLYVRCGPGMPFLFFGNNRSAEGRHNFDFRSGTGDAFETVDLTASCPDITRAEVFVNFYDGALRHSPKGIFGIEFGGKFFKAEFTLAAKTGNRAGGLREGLMTGPHWARIDLASVLHLRPAREGRSATAGSGPLK